MIIFDLDGTLTESKKTIDTEMAELLGALTSVHDVAIISGGSFNQFNKQVLPYLANGNKGRIFLFPTCATAFYRCNGDWRLVYEQTLTPEEKSKILDVLAPYAGMIYGPTVEDRASQITYSALGQQAPLHAKQKYSQDKRAKEFKIISEALPEFEVKYGGLTSIDITRKGIDKAYGIRKIHEYLGVKLEDMTFVGDALEPGGNDYPVYSTGIKVIKTSGIEETKKIIREIIGE